MENTINLSYQSLMKAVVKAVQKAISRFETSSNKIYNGSIRITFVPLCKGAEEWLGGSLRIGNDTDSYNEDCIREFVFKINPEGTHTIHADRQPNYKTLAKEKVCSCYGLTAMMVARRSWDLARQSGLHAKEVPDELTLKLTKDTIFDMEMEEIRGYSETPGTSCTIISLGDTRFVEVYIAVYGNKENYKNQQCAFAGMHALQTKLKNEASFWPRIRYQDDNLYEAW